VSRSEPSKRQENDYENEHEEEEDYEHDQENDQDHKRSILLLLVLVIVLLPIFLLSPWFSSLSPAIMEHTVFPTEFAVDISFRGGHKSALSSSGDSIAPRARSG
jgi:hypothetical protein